MIKNHTRDALIEVGVELIRSKGYTSTGINQILDKASTRSFYRHFASKDQFVIEVIQRYAAGEQKRWERLLGGSNLSALEKLRRYFEDMIATYGRGAGPIAGCLLGNLSLEIANHNKKARHLLRQSFNDWQKAIAMTIREAIDNGELPSTNKANDLAAVILDSWEGAQVRAKTQQSDKALKLFFESAFTVLLKADSGTLPTQNQ